jgi:putative methyltransferase (TIGR04325 family)
MRRPLRGFPRAGFAAGTMRQRPRSGRTASTGPTRQHPLFFWLLRLLHPRASVLDYGGSVGLTYYGYHRYARLPEGASWTIVELPLITDQGRRIAQREGTRNLFFTSDIGAPESCDILVAAG